jgi:LysM repeat protein
LVFLVGTAAYYFLKPGEEAGPVVLIRAPLFGEQVSANEMTIVQAIARAPKGVTRVELWVDGNLLAAKTSQLPQGSTPFPLIEGWYPKTPGKHILIVRAYNRALRSGQATVLVEALDLPKVLPQQTYPVREGDTLASIAESHGLTAEEIAARNPGISDPLPPGDTISLPLPSPEAEGGPSPEPTPLEPLPGEGPPDPLGGRETPPLIARLFSPFMRLPSGRWLEVEALSLEVNEDYDGVYCYYSLGGEPMERVPADGYLESLGERRWSIEGAMGGERRRVVIIPEGEGGLEIQGNCLGYRASAGGGEVFDLGTLTVSHFEAEWDGREIEQMAAGPGGWFRVRYRIRLPAGLGGPPPTPGPGEEEPEAGELPAPDLRISCSRRWIPPWLTVVEEGVARSQQWFVTCVLGWSLPALAPGVGVEVDGFLILRNGALLEQVSAEQTGRLLTGWQPYGPLATIVEGDGPVRLVWPDTGDLPPPGETYEFQVIAYVGDPFADPPAGYRSPPSNLVTIGSEIWAGAKWVRVMIEEFRTGMLDLDCNQFAGIMTGCGQCDADSWGASYGHISVNGTRVMSPRGWFPSCTTWRFTVSEGYPTMPSIALVSGPDESITISMRFWDYDVWSANDPFCHGDYVFDAGVLERISESPDGVERFEREFSGGDGWCWLVFTIQVMPAEEAPRPPPPIIIP